MEKTFPVIISELRKSAGLSQKEAAARLGISQALLSHYEKGIRECGQSFLIKIADFYGVTCDYLLGRSKSRTGLNGLINIPDAEHTAIQDTTKPVVSAVLIVREILYSTGNRTGVQLDKIAALELYKVLIKLADEGIVPKAWAGKAFSSEETPNNEIFLNLIDSAVNCAMKVTGGSGIVENADIPETVKAAVEIAEDYLYEVIKAGVPSQAE